MSTPEIDPVVARIEKECGLNPAIFDKTSRLGACYTPDTWYRAVAVAGNLLRKNFTDTYLARDVLSEDILGQNPTFPQTVLRSIVNSSLGEEQDMLPSASFPGGYTPSVEACANAEGYFSFELQAMGIGHKLPPTHLFNRGAGWGIVTTSNPNQPVGFIKAGRVKSFLSTEPIAIEDITFPAGSLFGATLKSVNPPNPRERFYIKPDQIQALRFRRLTAFALQPEHRRDTFSEVDFNDPVENWPMGEIRRVVRQALGSSVQRV